MQEVDKIAAQRKHNLYDVKSRVEIGNKQTSERTLSSNDLRSSKVESSEE